MDSTTASQKEQTPPVGSGKITDEYWPQLVGLEGALKDGEFHLGEFGVLQRLNLIHMQNELAEIRAEQVSTGTTNAAKMLRLRTVLHAYADAMRDWDYMYTLAQASADVRSDRRAHLQAAFPTLGTGPRNPFNTRYRTLNRGNVKRDVVRELLRKHLHGRLTWSPEERETNYAGYHAGEAPQTYSAVVDRTARFVIAVGGGASLLVPMLIMSFDASRDKSLIVVCVATILFALTLSLGFETGNDDTLTATATYAAVLVVFVGTSQ